MTIWPWVSSVSRSARCVLGMARAQWARFLLDRRGLALCFAVPVVLAVVFGSIFDRPAARTVRVSALLVAEDDDPFSVELAERLRRHPGVELTPSDRSSARERLERRQTDLVLLLPAGFARHLIRSSPETSPPRLEIWQAPGCELQAQVLEGTVTGVIVRQSLGHWLGPLAPRARFVTAGAGDEAAMPFTVTHDTVNGVAGASPVYGHSFCGMTIQYLLFWGMDGGLVLLRDRRRGVWLRLRSSPVSTWALLAGHALAVAVVALALIGTTLAVGAVGFGVLGYWSLVGLGCVSLALAGLSAAVGLLVAALGRSEAGARALAVMSILALSMLGGLWLPDFLFPGWVRSVSVVLPTTWALRGLEAATWRGLGTGEAVTDAAVVAGFAVVFLGLAAWFFCRDERARAFRGVS